MPVKDHLSDIDFRPRAERQKEAMSILVEHYKDLSNYLENNFSELLYGKFSMLGVVLWYLLPEKEYDALKVGKEFIDQNKFSPYEKRLFLSLNAFGGSLHCDKTSTKSVLASYVKRMKSLGRGKNASLIKEYPELSEKIANNIMVGSK